MRRMPLVALSVLVVLTLIATACATSATPPAQATTAPTTAAPTSAPTAAAQATTAPTTAPAVEPTSAQEYKFAAIFPGVITDSDYNTLGYNGVTAVESELGLETGYSEAVEVPDFERVLREYVDDGFNIIWAHGGEYFGPTTELAPQFPDVMFIVEGDSPVENAPPNLWVIGRNFHTGFYALGALAAKSTKTGKIGYIGGLTLPFSYSEVHAAEQAIEDLGLDVTVEPVWVGDFSDPTKARQLADAMIANDVDVIMGSLNLGMFGIFEAVKANPGNKVLVTAKYTDKTTFAPDNYLTAVLYDFSGPLIEIIQKIQAGEQGAFYELSFDNGVSLQMPLSNSDEATQAEIEKIVEDIKSGAITVEQDTTPIE